MVARSRAKDQLKAAMDAVADVQFAAAEKAEMLMEIAMGLQQKPKALEDLDAAVTLYEKALEICPADMALLSARIRARLGTVLMVLPSDGPDSLEGARDAFATALQTLTDEGSNEEVAEAEMNLGLALQNLAAMHRARIQDAIAAYQRALRTFDKRRPPKEFAILQNNLATAFLSIPFTDEKAKMREALAVQAFEEGLSVVTLIDHPSEYAMLQNNLGNALQCVSTSHPIENGFRALEAYDEALKVRTARNAPGAYANTVANKANCLANLPDDPADPDAGNRENLEQAIALYRTAIEVLQGLGEQSKVEMIEGAIAEILAEQGRAAGAAFGPH